MIIDFSVQNFGSIKDKQILSFEADKSNFLEDQYIVNIGKFRLLKLALIYGANASGKTTVLRALNFLGRLVSMPEEKKTDLLDFDPYLFDESTPKQNSIISINFIQKKVRYYYQVEFNQKCVVKEVLDFYNPKKANVFTRTTDTTKQLSKITFGSKIKADTNFEKVLVANTLWNNTVFGGFLKTNIDIKEIKNAALWFSSYMSAIITPDHSLKNYALGRIQTAHLKKEDIVNILKKADFNISDIIIDEEEEEVTEEIIKSLEKRNLPADFIAELKNKKKITSIDLLFQHNLDNKVYTLPFEFESKGTQRYFGLAGVLGLLIKESTMISIDELESSLHPDLYFHFLLSFLINAKKSQLIATTHNREIFNNKDLFRYDAIWFADKPKGATELYSLADFDTKVIRDTSSVYNAYKIGKLGGVPNLGDYYIDLSK